MIIDLIHYLIHFVAVFLDHQLKIYDQIVRYKLLTVEDSFQFVKILYLEFESLQVVLKQLMYQIWNYYQLKKICLLHFELVREI